MIQGGADRTSPGPLGPRSDPERGDRWRCSKRPSADAVLHFRDLSVDRSRGCMSLLALGCWRYGSYQVTQSISDRVAFQVQRTSWKHRSPTHIPSHSIHPIPYHHTSDRPDRPTSLPPDGPPTAWRGWIREPLTPPCAGRPCTARVAARCKSSSIKSCATKTTTLFFGALATHRCGSEVMSGQIVCERTGCQAFCRLCGRHDGIVVCGRLGMQRANGKWMVGAVSSGLLSLVRST